MYECDYIVTDHTSVVWCSLRYIIECLEWKKWLFKYCYYIHANFLVFSLWLRFLHFKFNFVGEEPDWVSITGAPLSCGQPWLHGIILGVFTNCQWTRNQNVLKFVNSLVIIRSIILFSYDGSGSTHRPLTKLS